MNPEDVLKEIADQTNVCTRCKLHFSRKNGVPGSGNPHSEILFIGEAPGFHENQKGIPFVGAAGKFLDELLEAIQLKREDVFITNVVKCRPPSNRDPDTEELEACRAYLERQIAAINPTVIVTLGRISMGYFIQNGKISSIHGGTFWSNGRMIIPMYHPAAALHQPSLREVIKADFLKLPELINKARANQQDVPATTKVDDVKQDNQSLNSNSAEQLSLF